MDHVKRVVYSDGNEEYDEDEVNQKFRMETVTVTFDCPVCHEEQDHEAPTPLANDERHTCSSCREQYFLYPIVTPSNKKKIANMTTREKLDLQLTSVAEFHRVASRYPEKATALASAPETAILGSLAVITAVGGLGLVAARSVQIPSDLWFSLGFFSVAIAIGLGSAALLFGAVGTIYDGYLIYRSIDPDYSFTAFVRHGGNYYHRNPFLRK